MSEEGRDHNWASSETRPRREEEEKICWRDTEGGEGEALASRGTRRRNVKESGREVKGEMIDT